MSKGKRTHPPDAEALRLFDVERYAPTKPPCPSCGAKAKPMYGYGPDPCLGGYLPNVAWACCGHGVAEDAYVVVTVGARPYQPVYELKDPQTLNGEEALRYFATLGVGPPREDPDEEPVAHRP